MRSSFRAPDRISPSRKRENFWHEALGYVKNHRFAKGREKITIKSGMNLPDDLKVDPSAFPKLKLPEVTIRAKPE